MTSSDSTPTTIASEASSIISSVSAAEALASNASAAWSRFVSGASDALAAAKNTAESAASRRNHDGHANGRSPNALVSPSATSGVVSSPLLTRSSLGQFAALTTGTLTAAGLLYALYRSANDHHAYITVTENVSLPPETTGDFVEISLPLEGEVRVECSTLAHCKYQLKLNASLKVDHGRVKNDNKPSSPLSANPKNNAVQLERVNKSELCDSWLSDFTGNLHFSPSCSSHDALLMTYASTTHDALQAAVAVRECFVEPASSLTAHRLTFNLHVYSSAMDVALSIILPKGSRVIKVSTGGKGSVSAPSIYAPHELTWNVGTFVREGDDSGADGTAPDDGQKIAGIFRRPQKPRAGSGARTVFKEEGQRNDERNAAYDKLPDLGDTLRRQQQAATVGASRESASLMEEGADLAQTMMNGTLDGLAAVELLAQEQMVAMTTRTSVVVPFELLYTIDIKEAERELNKMRSPSQATAAFMANNRRERRQMERERRRRVKKQQGGPQMRNPNAHPAVEEIPSDAEASDGGEAAGLAMLDPRDPSYVSFNPSEHTPGVHLSYSTQATASGLVVRKLLTSGEQPNYNLLEDLLGPAPPLPTEGSSDVSPPPPPAICYTLKQRIARNVINGAANALFSLRRKARFACRLGRSILTQTPIALTQAEIEEEEAYVRRLGKAGGAGGPRSALAGGKNGGTGPSEASAAGNISQLYDGSVRVPQSIVRQITKNDHNVPAVATPQSPYGNNPFTDETNGNFPRTGSYASMAPPASAGALVRANTSPAASMNPLRSPRNVVFADEVAARQQQQTIGGNNGGHPAVAASLPPPTPEPPQETFIDGIIREGNIYTPRLHKKVRYITRFSQQVKVLPQF